MSPALLILGIVAAVAGAALVILKPWKAKTVFTTPAASTSTNSAMTTTPGPTLPPIKFVTISGNNGSVGCPRFCNGVWGQGQLSKNYPGYTGALGASSRSADGSCKCLLTSQVSYDPVENWSAEKNNLLNTQVLPGSPLEFDSIDGNNGTMTCASYCNRSAALKTKFPNFSGAVSAQDQPDDKPTGTGGTCACMLTNKARWNQNDANSNLTNQDLLPGNRL